MIRIDRLPTGLMAVASLLFVAFLGLSAYVLTSLRPSIPQPHVVDVAAGAGDIYDLTFAGGVPPELSRGSFTVKGVRDGRARYVEVVPVGEAGALPGGDRIKVRRVDGGSLAGGRAYVYVYEEIGYSLYGLIVR